MRRAKIVATLGPATGTSDRIAALIEGGANVIRVNASHGTAETRGRWIEVVRRGAGGLGLAAGAVGELSGPLGPPWGVGAAVLAPPRVMAGLAHRGVTDGA